MPGFFVRPLESLYFGPPRSFSAGEAHRGHGEFPPTPQSFQGLVRSHLLQSANPPINLNDWSEQAKRLRESLVGGADDLPRGWQFTGPFPAEPYTAEDGERQTRLWLPTPRFLMRHASRQPVRARALQSKHPGLNDLTIAGLEFLPVGAPADSAGDSLGGWVSSRNLRWALANDVTWQPDQYGEQLPPFVRRERQSGVARDQDDLTAKAGMLYFLDAVRFHDPSGLAAWLDGEFDRRLDSNCLTDGLAGAGRRRRPVAFETPFGPDPDWQWLAGGRHLPTTVPDACRAWLVLLTPAQLKDPLRPDLPTTSAAVQATVRAALLGAPVVVGGYSIVTGRMRNNKTFVPAGSAWLIELTGGTERDRAATLRSWNGRHLWGTDFERAIGFGHVLVGTS